MQAHYTTAGYDDPNYLTVAPPSPKPKINLAQLDYVLSRTPEKVRTTAPLPVLESHLYGMVFEDETLIEEVEAVLSHEATRRAAPAFMAVSR